jgi:hypothetical protein
MLVSTVGDELKSASRQRTARFIPGVRLSLKDRSAVLPAGHMANAAFCLDTKTGAFVTSTYYRADLPAWAAAFARRSRPTPLQKDVDLSRSCRGARDPPR